MEGPLSKWTNLVNGWQYRWFVLDLSLGVLSYYTSKEKMMRGDRRGCVKLKNAQVGIDDVDDSTFTITVDHKTFHFQARDSKERQKWLDALQEARDLHTENYTLLHQTNRLLERPCCLSEFDRRIVEADAYLQILIDQHAHLTSQLPSSDECRPEILDAVTSRMQRLIELVKKTIVCLQFARGSVSGTYGQCVSNICFTDTSQRSVNDANSSIDSLGHLSPNMAHDLSSPKLSELFNDVSRTNGLSSTVPFHTTRLGDTGAASNTTNDNTSSIIAPLEPSVLIDSKDTHFHHPQRHSFHSKDMQSMVYGSTLSSSSSATPLPRGMYNSHAGLKSIADCHSMEMLSNPSKVVPNTMLLRSYSSSDNESDMASFLPDDEDDEFFDTHEDVSTNLFANALVSNVHNSYRESNNDLNAMPVVRSTSIPLRAVSNTHDCDQHLCLDELYDDWDEEELESVQSHGSVITHLLSQLRIGMDLTRITLPTFILERRSTLEMYADFLAHVDLWVAIADGATPRDRIVACLRWYLSAFHAGRKTSVAKKPYNPILGEVFRCYWPLQSATTSSSSNQSDRDCSNASVSSAQSTEGELVQSGPVPWSPNNSVTFLSEQVSHHPPISAFYAEHIPKRIAVDGHLWTKSKFLGLSIAVEMVGSAVISLLDSDEEYVVTFPCGYGRNILTVPWIELGGKTCITCAQTGYVANIEFRTKPFYGGKRDLIRAEVFEPNEKRSFLQVEGEWNDKMWAKWINGKSNLFIDVGALPMIKKHVQPRSSQLENESRRMWEEVTYNLKMGNIDAASDAKSRLEQKQRESARIRRETKQIWNPVQFYAEDNNWLYRNPLNRRLKTIPSLSKTSNNVDDVGAKTNNNNDGVDVAIGTLLSAAPPRDQLSLDFETDSVIHNF